MQNVITHAADNRNLAAYLNELNRKIRLLTDKVCCLTDAINNGNGAGETPNVQTTSSGISTSIPAGFRSIAITQLTNTGTVNITLSDGSVYPLSTQYEVFVDAASIGDVLPAYTITSDTETWKWHGIK